MPRLLLPDADWLAFTEAAARYVFLNWAFQASLLLLAALVVARLPRVRPGLRHGLLLGALTAAAALPVSLLLPLKQTQIGSIGRQVLPARQARGVSAHSTRPAPGSADGTMSSHRSDATFPGLALGAGWLLLLIVRLCRVGFGLRTVRRWGRRSLPVNRHLLYDACRCRMADVDVSETEEVRTPTVAGVLRPRILLPLGLAAALPSPALRQVLLHEEAHVRRRDPLWLFIAELALAAVGWHPLAESVRRSIARAAEDACDHRVLASGVGGPEYARTLLAVVERAAPVRPLAATCPLGCPGVELRRRVSQILYGASPASRMTASLAGATVALAVSGALALEPGTRPSPPTSKASVASAPALRPDPAPSPARPRFAKPALIAAPRPAAPRLLNRRARARLAYGLPVPERWEPVEAELAEARASVPREGRVVVFLLDVSTSMRPYQDEARSGILQQIELLRPMDQFNVLAFSGEVSRFAEMPVAPGEDSLAAVRAWVGGLDERAGSDLGAGITQALGTPGVTSLVIYSDGRASAGIVDPAGLGALVASENRSHAQLFTVAFGVPAGAGSELFPGAARFAPPPAETRAEERPNDDLRP